MKKLVVLPNINGLFGKSAEGRIYPYDFEQGVINNSSYDVYLVDSKAAITKNCWLVDGYGELIHSSEITIDDVSKHYIQGVVIASTDVRTKLPTIDQVIIDGFLDSNCKNNVVETMEFGDGSHEIMLVSEFLNEWVGVDTTLDLSDVAAVNAQICKDFPIQDDIWPSRRWNEDHTDYCDLGGEPDTIEVNGKVLYKRSEDCYDSILNYLPEIGDLWFQPNSSSKFYPDIRGRLLEFCKAEVLTPNPGFDDWAEIQIHSINGFYK